MTLQLADTHHIDTLARQFSAAIRQEAYAAQLVAVSDVGSAPIRAWELAEDPEEMQTLAGEILDTAEQDTDGAGQTSTFAVYFYPDISCKGSPIMRSPQFTLRPELVTDGAAIDLRVNPTERGILVAMMKRDVERDRMFFQVMPAILVQQGRSLDDARRRCAELEKTVTDNVRIREELLDRRAERDLQIREHSASFELKQKAMDTLFSQLLPAALPGFVSFLAAKGILPEEMSKLNPADITLGKLMGVFGDLDSEQLKELGEVIGAERMAALVAALGGK